MAHPASRRKRRGLWLGIALGVAAVLALAVFANGKFFPKEDPYRNWPAAGTMTQGAILRINGLAVLTCDKNGNPYMEERSFGTDKEGRKVLPSEYIVFYTNYFPRQSEDCDVSIAPLLPTQQTLRIIETSGEGWVEKGIEASFDGLRSMHASKKSDGIAVLLIMNNDLSQGVEVKTGTNGLPAPSKDLLS